MDTQRTVWQIAAGPASRSYAEVFLQHGVGLIGPGDAGPWSEDCDDDQFGGGFVRRFATEVREGDVFLMRTGLSRVSAIGIVSSEYTYFDPFDDVNGWDLQHSRRVRWFKLPCEHDFGSPVFGANPPRFGRVNNPIGTDYAFRFVNSPPTHWQAAALPPLPEREPALADVPQMLRGPIAEAQDLLSLYWDRGRFGDRPSEDELVVHYANLARLKESANNLFSRLRSP